MKVNHLFIVGIILFCVNSLSGAEMIQKVEYKKTKIFYTDDDKQGWNAFIVGKVLSLGQRDIENTELNQTSQEKSKISVRLYSADGIRPGQTLFVINERNLVVSRIEVKTVFKSISFGYLCTGYGNFRRVSEDFNVALKVEEVNDSYSYVYKSRADYFQKTGDKSKSMQMYEKAIESDPNNATAHMKLGYLYYDQKVFTYAKKEFELAYESLWNVYDNQDKFDIIKGMILTRYALAYESDLPAGNALRIKYVNEGVKYSQEALALNKNSIDINYYYGYFLYNSHEPHDSKAKEQMLKVIELDRNFINAHIVLSRLFYKHKNQDKAIEYAENALKIDPSNLWAQDTYKKVKISF